MLNLYHTALKCRFSIVSANIKISKVRFSYAPPHYTANALQANVLAFFFFGFSRLFPEITDFQTKNPTKSLDLTGSL